MSSRLRKKLSASLIAASLGLGSLGILAVPAANAATPANPAKVAAAPAITCGIGVCCFSGGCIIGVCCHWTF